MSKNSKCYIFGAGKFGKDCWNFFHTIGKQVEGFVVTSRNDNPSSLFDLPVFEYNEVKNYDADFVIAIKKKNEVCNMLSERKSSNIDFYPELKSKELENFIYELKYKKTVYIYGAGKYGKSCVSLLKKYNINIKCVIVTESKGNPDNIDGINVVPINEITFPANEDNIIILALKESYRKSVLLNLKARNLFSFSFYPEINELLCNNTEKTSINVSEVTNNISENPTSSSQNLTVTDFFNNPKIREFIDYELSVKGVGKERRDRSLRLNKLKRYKILFDYIDKNLIKIENEEIFHKRLLDNKDFVLLVSHELDLTGAPIAIQYMAESFIKLGKCPLVVSPRDGLLKNILEQNDIPVTVIQDIYYSDFVKKISECCSLVVVNTIIGFPLVKMLSCTQLPILWWIHEANASYSNELLAQLPEELESNVSIYAVGNYAKNILNHHRPKYLIKNLLYFVPDFSQHYNNEGNSSKFIKGDKKIFVSVGTIMYRKGQDILCDAIEKLTKDKINNSLFYFVGKQVSPEIYNRITESISKFPNNIIYIESLEPDSLKQLYNVMDCLICCSRDDPMPIVITEALIKSKFVICSENTGSAEIINNYCGGLVYHNDSSAELSQCIENVIEEKIHINEYLINTRKIYEENFSEKIFLDNISSIYSSITKKRFVFSPKISCVIPNYNYKHFLPERIDSILKQTYPIYELIILDDNSSDGSDIYIESILPKLNTILDGNVKYIRNNRNAGVFAQWNKGIQEASGDYIWIAEADDLCDRDFLIKLVAGIKENPTIGIAWANSIKIDENGEYICDFSNYYEGLPLGYTENYVRSGFTEIINALSIKNTIINASSVLMKREFLLDIPVEFLKHKLVGDWLIYCHILKQSNIYFCCEKLNFHREQKQSVTYQMNNQKVFDYLSECNFVHKYILENFPISPQILSYIYSYNKLLYSVYKNQINTFDIKQQDILLKNIKSINSFNKKSKKRMCIFSTNDYGWGGSEVSCMRFAEKLSYYDDFEVLLCMPDHFVRPIVLSNVVKNKKMYFCGRVTKYYNSNDDYYSMIKYFNPDLLLISQGSVFEGEELMNWCQRENIPYCNYLPLFTAYQVAEIKKREMSNRIKKAFSKSKVIISDNNQSGEKLKEVLLECDVPFKMLPNFFDINYDQPIDCCESDGDFSLAYFGRLTALHKGLDILLKVLEQDKWISRPLTFYFYGDGEFKSEIEKSIKTKGTKIILKGFSNDCATEIHKYHGLVFASRMEGTPLTLVDSMLCHRMVIGTPVGGLPDYIVDGETGFLAEGNDFFAIDSVLERAWEKRTSWKSLGINAGKFIRKMIPKNVEDYYVELFTKIILGNIK